MGGQPVAAAATETWMTEQTQPLMPPKPRARAATPSAAGTKTAARKDPRRSHVDGMREGRLYGEGYRPQEFHYVLVDKAATMKGVEYYELLGYSVVRPADKVKITGRMRENADGVVEWGGHVLMACPLERHREIVQEGPGGDSGLQLADVTEKALIKRKGLIGDPFRGLGVTRDHMMATVDDKVVDVTYDDE